MTNGYHAASTSAAQNELRNCASKLSGYNNDKSNMNNSGIPATRLNVPNGHYRQQNGNSNPADTLGTTSLAVSSPLDIVPDGPSPYGAIGSKPLTILTNPNRPVTAAASSSLAKGNTAPATTTTSTNRLTRLRNESSADMIDRVYGSSRISGNIPYNPRTEAMEAWAKECEEEWVINREINPEVLANWDKQPEQPELKVSLEPELKMEQAEVPAGLTDQQEEDLQLELPMIFQHNGMKLYLALMSADPRDVEY